MRATTFLAILALTLPAVLAGCIGTSDGDLLTSTAVEPTGRVVELESWVETIEQEIYPGYTAELWAFCFKAQPGSEDALELRDGENCSVPGPTIRVDQGDRLIVEFRNPHDFPHTIHWHGQTLSWEDDGVPGMSQNTTEQGHTYTYDYLVERPGTLFYHCHVDTQHHVFMGLYGAIIVEPQDQDLEPEVDQDRTLVLSHGNVTHMAVPEPGGDAHAHHRGEFGSGNPGKQNGAFDVDYDIFMINGKSFPHTMEDPDTITKVEEGEKVRLRFINSGFLTETMHLHGHDMVVTHKDGLPLGADDRYKVDTLRIAPGERYDVVVLADNPGKWPLHTHFPQHVTNDHQYPGGMLTALVYDGYEDVDFRSELPGGQGGQAAGGHGGHGGHNADPLPENFQASHSDEVTAADYSQAYDLPVEDERAQKVTAKFTLTPGTLSATDELTLSLLDPEGQVLKEATMNADQQGTTLVLDGVETEGTFTALVEGRGLQASYTLDLAVLYDDPHAHH